MRRLIFFVLAVLAIAPQARADEPPKSLDSRLKIELFAEHPQIVTPTGLDVDHKGRVWAIESNTHFPPEDYKGHPTDRVLVMSDSDGDGKADKIVVFTDGLKHTMSIAVRPIWFPLDLKSEISNLKSQISNPKTSVFIATRGEILQLHDDDGDDKADRQERLVHLDTKGDYPHNGLAGFAIDALGWMYFGFGENLGADYKIIGSDGTTLSGGGEGGNIYRCRLDGSKLSHIATGFWNPHASCFDAFGRLFTVDNDADSRPPCRLLHVIPGGDYGYRFRNGRKGLHPFTAWNGEIPGTLPMVAGTGEAPSGIVAYESDGLPEEYLGNLLVTSWGDHRIDRFRLQPKGTSFTSLAEPVITGGENFRPVGIATAPDGSLFCTDWVLREYKLHGNGRIWRIAPKESRKVSVIDLTSIPQRPSNELIELMKSPRRDVCRYAAQTLATRPNVDHQAVIPLWGKIPRFDLESLWAIQSIRLSWNAEWILADVDDPFIGWAATSPRHRQPSMRMRGQSVEDAKTRIRGNVVRGLSTLLNRDPAAVPFASTPPMKSKSSARMTPWNEDFASLAPLIAQAPLDEAIVKLALSNDDPFIFATIVTLASRQFSQDDFATYLIPDATPDMKSKAPKVRQAILLAARKQAPKEDRLLRVALSDHDPDVRRLAVQWVAEEKLTDLRPKVEAIFDGGGTTQAGSLRYEVTPELFLATLAALEMLDGKKPEDFDKTPAEQYVVPLLKDEKSSPAVRAQALRLVSPTDKSLDAPFFASLLNSDHEPLRVEAIHTLQAARPEVSGELLRELVANDKLDVQLRAEAMVGLAAVAKTEPVGGPTRKLLKTFLNNKSPMPLRIEAIRSLRGLLFAEDKEFQDGLMEIVQSLKILENVPDAVDLTDQIMFAANQAKRDVLPDKEIKPFRLPTTRQEWMDELNRGREVDPAAGRRVFFHPNGPGCFKCHIVDGRGGRVGPDLSRAIGNMNRIQLIQSILEPSREIAPQFVTWTFELHSGKVITGMIVHENEGKTIVGDAEGKLTELKTIDIESRTPQKISVMPDKLAERMTLQELHDVIAFLETQR